MGEVKTICRCCAAGCGISVTVEGETVVEVRGDRDHPLTQGYICPKGNSLSWHHHRPDRLDHAFVRGERTTWERCATDLADSVRKVVERHGPSSFGAYAGTGGGSLDFASGMTLRRLLRDVKTTQNYSPTTVDMAPAYRAAEMVAGSAAELQPRWIPEDEESKLVIFIGCNPFVSHGYFSILPDAARRIRRFQNRGGRVWVLDPRRTETARKANGHIVMRPNTDSYLLAWLLRETLDQPPDPALLARSTWAQDLDALREILRPLTRRETAARCGITEDEIQHFVDDVRAAGRHIGIVAGTGANFAKHALTTEWLRWALMAATGALDQPGGMHFETGYVSKLDERTNWTAAPATGALTPSAGSRPDLFGITGEYPCAAMVDEIEAGNLKALLIAGGSPLTAFPQPERLRKALQSLEVLAVFDVVSAPLTEIATHVLPSLAQLERTDIVFWNGHISLAPAVVKPVAGRQPAWRAYARIAKALGINDFFYGLDADTATETDVLTAITANARYDLATLVAAGPSGMTAPAKTNWVAKSLLPEGRWRIAPPPMVDRLKGLLAQDTTADTSLILVSRRQTQKTSSTQYIRTERRYDRPSLQIGAADAASHGIADGQTVRVTSASGAVSAVAEFTDDLRPGVVSFPHGWFAANAASLVSGRAGDVDPMTGQPQMSGIPVTIEALAS